MKRLLLPLLAALALPTAVNAESYNAGLAKLQYKKMIHLEENSGIFMLKGDRVNLIDLGKDSRLGVDFKRY